MKIYGLAFSLGKSFKRCRVTHLQVQKGRVPYTNVSDSYKRELLLHVLFIESNQLKINLMSQRHILDVILFCNIDVRQTISLYTLNLYNVVI